MILPFLSWGYTFYVHYTYNFRYFHLAADDGKGLLRFEEFIGVVYRFRISLPIKLFLITGVTVGGFFLAFFAVAARTDLEIGFSSSELDEVRLGLGVQGLENSPDDSPVLPIVFVRRFLLNGFRILLIEGERR
jgi:hypothetical protein